MSRAHPASRLLRHLGAALAAPGGPGPGEHLLAAVSGGPDSTALLAGLAELAPSRGLRITAAYVDHALRGSESAAECAAVATLSRALGVGFVTQAAAVEPGSGVEVRARRVRYRALVAMADQVGAGRIVTGHTQDDQVETLLLRLLRGAGRRGLGAIAPHRGRLLRPLLGVTRADIRRFLAERGIAFAVDRTNAELCHARNRVRRLLVPFLEVEFNPRLGPALAALADRLRAEEAFLEKVAAERAAHLVTGDHLRASVGEEPIALARRIIRRWLGPAVTAAQVERVLALADGRARGAVAIPGPARVLREGDVVVRRRGREAADTRITLPITPGETVADPFGRWRLHLGAPRVREPGEERAADASHALLDAEALPTGLVVRSAQPGDRVHVPGVGTRKVQDILVDARVPREARPGVPLLVAGDEILWVAGVMRGSGARVAPATHRVVEGILERSA